MKDITTTKKQKETSENQKGKGENSMSPTDTDESLFDKIIPSKKQTLYSLTLYHTTYMILIQGNRKSIWVTKEFPLMKAVINHKCKNNTSITDAYNQILETENKTTTPNKIKQKDDSTSKTPEPNQTNQDHNNSSNNITTPSNITNSKPQIAQNHTATTTYSPNIDDNNASIKITKNAQCKNNSIKDNVPKEADKGQSHKVNQLRKIRKNIHMETPKRGAL